ncbi:hypothetical protein EC991_007317 [Linnemannia zychae]|nr:hypothetical protein EC991_007317 [Linnemannia zychae]
MTVNPLLLSAESEIIHIDYRMDPISMKKIVLWGDILLAFEDAVHVRHNSRVLPFLRGPNFQVLEPFRIEAMPDVVLCVVIRDPLNQEEASTSLPPSTVLPVQTRETLSTAGAPINNTARISLVPPVVQTAVAPVTTIPAETVVQHQNSLRIALSLLDDNEDDEDDNAPPPNYQEAISSGSIAYTTTTTVNHDTEASSRILGHRLPSSSSAIPFLPPPPAYSTPARTSTARTNSTNIRNNRSNTLATATTTTAATVSMASIAARYSAAAAAPSMRPSEYMQYLQNASRTSNTTNISNTSNAGHGWPGLNVGRTTTTFEDNVNNVAMAIGTAVNRRTNTITMNSGASLQQFRPQTDIRTSAANTTTTTTTNSNSRNTNNSLGVPPSTIVSSSPSAADTSFSCTRISGVTAATTASVNNTAATPRSGVTTSNTNITANTRTRDRISNNQNVLNWLDFLDSYSPISTTASATATTAGTVGVQQRRHGHGSLTEGTPLANPHPTPSRLDLFAAVSPSLTPPTTTGASKAPANTIRRPLTTSPAANATTTTASATVSAVTNTTTATIATAVPLAESTTPLFNIEHLIARAKQGDRESQFQLAAIYRDGTHGVTQDYYMATKWFLAIEKSIDSRTRAEAQFAIAAMYESGGATGIDLDEDDQTGGGSGGDGDQRRSRQVQQTGTPDFKKAREWYFRAANAPQPGSWVEGAYQGHAGAEYKVGEFYWKGLGGSEYTTMTNAAITTTQDTRTALVWFIKAANKGHVKAQWSAGMAYLQGSPFTGVRKDLQKALGWFVKAAEQGYADAQWQAGKLYMEGKGDIKVDKDKALDWWKEAALLGHLEAQQELLKRGVSI